MSAWRQAGLNYINYSTIASKILRRSLKQEFRAEALKRDASGVRLTPWANGKPAREDKQGLKLLSVPELKIMDKQRHHALSNEIYNNQVQSRKRITL